MCLTRNGALSAAGTFLQILVICLQRLAQSEEIITGKKNQ